LTITASPPIGAGAFNCMIREPLTAQSRLRARNSFHHRVRIGSLAKRIFVLPLAVVFCTSVHAQDQPCKVIAAGQEFWIRLTQPVATYSSKRGTAIQAMIIASPACDSSPAFAAGTLVEGRITNVRRVGMGVWHGSSAVTIDFDKVISGQESLTVETRIEEVANGRETVKRGVIQGIGGQATPQEVMSTRLLHLPFWNSEAYWIFLLRRGAFPFSPEPEIYLPAGTDLRLRLMAPLEIPEGVLPAPAEENTPDEAEIDADLREKLLALPDRSLTGSGRPSDIVNLAFLGSREQIETAFRAAGWTYGDAVSTRSVLREMRAFSSLNSYTHLPISNQWLGGRAADIRLEKSFDSYQKREHIRIWNQDALESDLWVSGAIRETGASWSLRTGRFIHHVDADLDAERDKVARDLTLSGCVANVHHLQREESPVREKNASGDALWTDGGIAVIELKDCEAPPVAELTSSAELPWRPKSRIKRFVRAQALSIHDLWRSNVIYVSFDLGLTVVHSLRHRRRVESETKPSTSVRTASAGVN
jgi:LssY-like putative type I secretion system component LssY